MPQPFHSLTRDEFADLLEQLPFTRRIDVVHLHHTWRPNHAQYRGHDSIVAMWRFHTEENHWRDIAQHVSVAPDGAIWTGRDWNDPPASAVGFNGNEMVGPFMIEMIGDFDTGRDTLDGEQRQSAIEVIARVQLRFGLPADALRFHREMTTLKSCPGTGVDPAAIAGDVERARRTLQRRAAPAAAQRWADDARLALRSRTGQVMLALAGGRRSRSDRPAPPEAEPLESEMTDGQIGRALGGDRARGGPGAAPGRARGDDLTPEELTALRPHVVNLTQGRFSSSGRYQTSAADVDAIFDDHLERRLAQDPTRPVRLLFWAHGGLISEASGLRIAHDQVAWWNRNGIYPIHFAWETGLLDALWQILGGARQLMPRVAARDLWDHTTDPAIEATVRLLGGDKIWLAMKVSAELASGPEGGATYVARRLEKFCASHPGEVELHAVGHSAGSIFHAHFLPAALDVGVPAFRSLSLLAPAIRVDEFRARLAPFIGRRIERLAMFTMARDWERDDSVAGVYRKSLLYLIHHALEPEPETPILGLETSAREDSVVRQLFGLGGPSGPGIPPGEVVWAVTEGATGRAASTSRTHGGFDNDRATMNSVARRVADADAIVDFPEEAIERAARLSAEPPPLPAAVAAVSGNGHGATAGGAIVSPYPPSPPPGAGPAGGPGRRRALCVGIDRYASAPLAGCVADARMWAATLAALGFESTLLVDEAATRTAIVDSLRRLVASGEPGDVLVFQFAGHGTRLPDVDGDEAGEDTPDRDEALCPVDFASGAFVIDDDLRQELAAIPDGVNVTLFADCCHSGTITRLAVGPTAPARGRSATGSRRARFLRADGAMIAAHRRYREHLGPQARSAPRPLELMREVVFSACLSGEVAYENGGHGDFTLRATGVLAGGIAGLSHADFQRRVTEAFGATPAQHPYLECAPAARGRGLLLPVASRGAVAGRGAGGPPGGTAAGVAEELRALAERLAPRA